MVSPDLPPLNLPKADLKFKLINNRIKVFDKLRGKYITLTPEEYVRQHFVSFLINHLHYPASRLANEVAIRLNDTSKRCDTVFYDIDASPLIIIEYKAPHIEISQDVFDQIVRYNMRLKAKYLIVSNGIRHFCCVVDYDNDTYHFLPQLPDYTDLTIPFSSN